MKSIDTHHSIPKKGWSQESPKKKYYNHILDSPTTDFVPAITFDSLSHNTFGRFVYNVAGAERSNSFRRSI